MKLKKPLNQTAAVLRLLITKKKVSERQTPFNGFRARVSELRQQVSINFTVEKFVNQFGRVSHYREHYLQLTDKSKAVELYNKINVKK